jgi:FkbM family methyltransferase
MSANVVRPARPGFARTRFGGQALAAATRIYRATPFRRLRAAYFQLFLRLVRGRRVVRTIEGMTFDLDLGEMIDVGLFLQQYERDIVSLVERLTQPGWTVFDIGANIGAHTIRFSTLVGPRGRVFAFEPMDYAFNKLTRNLSLNETQNTRAFKLALSDENAVARRVNYRSSWSTTGERLAETSSVDFRRLDDWCVEHDITRVDLIKLDVDGHEWQVLKGGLSSIALHRPIVLIEAGAWHFTSLETNPLELLATCGYRFWETTTGVELDLSAVRQRLPERDEEMAVSINLVASSTPLQMLPAGSDTPHD